MLYDIDDVNYEVNLEYNVMFYDFNKKELISKNIFFKNSVQEILSETDKGWNFVDIEEAIKKWARYHYWCRREYELFIGDAFEEDLSKYEKVDIYNQIMLNIDLITEYFCKRVFSSSKTKDDKIKELSSKLEKANAKIEKLELQDIPYLKGYIEGMKEFQKNNA